MSSYKDHLQELARLDPRYARLLPRVASDKTPAARVELPCIHEGPDVRVEGSGRRFLVCEHPDTPLGSPVCKCQGCGMRCPRYTPDLLLPGDVPAGVVIGSYKWPSVVELNVKLIRAKCGDVPILVSDDSSARQPQLREACKRLGVDFVSTHERIGHMGGDVAAFHNGVRWAKAKGLKVVAKLSQRMLILRERWLQKGAEELLASGLPLATQECKGATPFPLRTEACLLDVNRWYPIIDSHLAIKTYSPQFPNGEEVINHALRVLGGVFWPWDIFGEVREHDEPEVIWHWLDDRIQYARVAQLYGVRLEHDFHTEGWKRDHDAGEHKFG